MQSPCDGTWEPWPQVGCAAPPTACICTLRSPWITSRWRWTRRRAAMASACFGIMLLFRGGRASPMRSSGTRRDDQPCRITRSERHRYQASDSVNHQRSRRLESNYLFAVLGKRAYTGPPCRILTRHTNPSLKASCPDASGTDRPPFLPSPLACPRWTSRACLGRGGPQ